MFDFRKGLEDERSRGKTIWSGLTFFEKEEEEQEEINKKRKKKN
jgi:hypothetical protein